jgi:hypothetical protein
MASFNEMTQKTTPKADNGGGSYNDLIKQYGEPKPTLGENLGDVGRLWLQGQAGLGGNIGYGLQKTGIAPELGAKLRASGAAETARLGTKLTPQMQEAQAEPLINPDYQPGTEGGQSWLNPNFGLRSLAANVVPSAPSSLVMGVAGAPVAGLATKGLGALGVGQKLAPLISRTPLAGKALTAAGENINKVIGSSLGFSGTEGVLSGTQNADQWGTEQRAINTDEFAKGNQDNPLWHEALQANNNDPEAAKEALISKGENDILIDTSLKTGALSALTGGGVPGLIMRRAHPLSSAVTESAAKTIGKGMGIEFAQEAPQSFYEQKTTNQATKSYVNPQQDVNAGTWNAGLVGGISGGVMGALGGGGSALVGPLTRAAAQAPIIPHITPTTPTADGLTQQAQADAEAAALSQAQTTATGAQYEQQPAGTAGTIFDATTGQPGRTGGAGSPLDGAGDGTLETASGGQPLAERGVPQGSGDKQAEQAPDGLGAIPTGATGKAEQAPVGLGAIPTGATGQLAGQIVTNPPAQAATITQPGASNGKAEESTPNAGRQEAQTLLGQPAPDNKGAASFTPKTETELLLDSQDAGGVPAFISKNLRKIANDNGVTVLGTDSAEQVVNKIRAAYAANQQDTKANGAPLEETAQGTAGTEPPAPRTGQPAAGATGVTQPSPQAQKEGLVGQAEAAEGLIFGHTWDEIKSLQQKGQATNAVRPSPLPVATEDDIKQLKEIGIDGLKDKQFFGVIDRLQNSGIVPKQEPTPNAQASPQPSENEKEAAGTQAPSGVNQSVNPLPVAAEPFTKNGQPQTFTTQAMANLAIRTKKAGATHTAVPQGKEWVVQPTTPPTLQNTRVDHTETVQIRKDLDAAIQRMGEHPIQSESRNKGRANLITIAQNMDNGMNYDEAFYGVHGETPSDSLKSLMSDIGKGIAGSHTAKKGSLGDINPQKYAPETETGKRIAAIINS